MAKQLKTTEPVVLLSKQTGVSVIPSDTLLTRLNYYDGKFLRAEDLQTEQRYLRNLVQLSNQTGGSGVAHGYDVMLSGGGDTLNVGPGLAIDPAGRVLLLPQVVTLNVQELIERSRQMFASMKASGKGAGSVFDDCEFVSETPPDLTPQSGDFYVITISHAEAYCGQEDVYGQLCKEACASSTDRPYIIEGLVIRAEPLQLETLLAQSKAVMLTQKHLRSQVASAYFNDERNHIKSLILKAGIQSNVWCFGALAAGGSSVPIALLARAGQSTLFLDAWTARRELIDTPAKRYWQWRMSMRPWDVFLAHILQFQCQLSDLFKNTPDPAAEDPCKDELELLAEAEIAIAQINQYFAQVSNKLASLDFGANAAAIKDTLDISQANVAKYGVMQKKFELAKESAFIGKFDHILINGGIIELPSAGYLPVAPGSNVSVNQQVRKLLGDGVDLRFCIVRPDYVPHALEQAQHMERISLVEGLDNPEMKPEVDILVPGGELFEDKLAQAAGGFEAGVTFTTPLLLFLSRFFSGDLEFEGDFESSGDNADTSGDATGDQDETLLFQGAARAVRLPSGGGAFHISTWAEYEEPAARMGSAAMLVDAMEAAPPPPAASKRGGAKQAKKAAPRPAKAEANIYERLKVVAAQAIRYYAQKRAAGVAGGMDNTARMKNKPQVNTFRARSNRRTSLREANVLTAQGGINAEAASVPKRAVGLWFTMKSEQNIFELKQNQTASLDLRGVLAAPSQDQENYIDAWLHGELLVTETGEAGGERIVKGSIKVMASFDLQVDGDTLKTSAIVNIKVEARLKKEGQGHVVTLLLKHNQFPSGFRFDINLNGDPLNVGAKIRFFDNRQNIDELMVQANLSANPSVAQAGHPAHVKALSGIQTIASATSNPSFTPNATALLFPPPPPPTEELVVRGTLDWVLFHRRRTRQCGLEPQAAPAVRRYNIYQAPFESVNPKLIPKIIDGIPSEFATLPPSGLGEDIFPAGQVEFGGGGSTIADPNSLLEAWEARVLDGAILYGGIASTGNALQDDHALALARLANVRQVLNGKLPIHPLAQFNVLPSMPPFLAQQGVDGVILIWTGKVKVQTVCHSVYHARDSIVLTQMQGMIKQGNIAGALKLADFLGVVNFDSESLNAPDLQSLNQVKQAWMAAAGTEPRGALLVSPPGDDQTANANKKQLEVIREALGNNPNFILIGAEGQSPLPGGCPAISIFTPTQHKP